MPSCWSMLWTSKAVIRPSLSWSIKTKAVRNSKFLYKCEFDFNMDKKKFIWFFKYRHIITIYLRLWWNSVHGGHNGTDTDDDQIEIQIESKGSGELLASERKALRTGEREGHGPTATKNTKGKTSKTRDVFHLFWHDARAVLHTYARKQEEKKTDGKKRTSSTFVPPKIEQNHADTTAERQVNADFVLSTSNVTYEKTALYISLFRKGIWSRDAFCKPQYLHPVHFGSWLVATWWIRQTNVTYEPIIVWFRVELC